MKFSYQNVNSTGSLLFLNVSFINVLKELARCHFIDRQLFYVIFCFRNMWVISVGYFVESLLFLFRRFSQFCEKRLLPGC